MIRNHNELLEILMLRRSLAVTAASGAHVFPGGVLDEVDSDVLRRGLFTGLDEERAAQRLSLEAGALTFYCAAVRELFEEAGLLLVLDPQGRTLHLGAHQLSAWRAELLSGSLTWPDLLEREDMRLALGELEYLAHWVTPVGRSRRFDTRFFVALAPPGQDALADDSEIVEHVWTSAAAALERFETGEWSMLVPTVRTLISLSTHGNVEDVVRAAATSSVPRIQPREIERDGRTFVVVPGDSGYSDAGEADPTPR
ncbi:MAG: NUDIX domain-containing protein [Acidimicrobiaceae bacterium]|nr:NUDIX domain-containing protein [Acidimicrobiaceae bacterium]